MTFRLLGYFKVREMDIGYHKAYYGVSELQ